MRKDMKKYGEVDCYDRISESSQRKRASKMDYERNYGVAVADLNCMITGISQSALHAPAPTSPMPENPVTCSYLLPRSAYASDRESLGYKMDDIESIRNTLLLCKGIKRAFDRKKLSFVPADNPFSNNQYKLHIWADSIRTEPIYQGASQTIGEFEGFALNLTVGGSQHNPFKRALSYQAFRAFKKYYKESGATELPVDSDYSEYQGSYIKKRQDFAKDLAKAVAADAEENEEHDDAADDALAWCSDDD